MLKVAKDFVDVDFDRLIASNKLGHGWSKHFDVSGNRYMSFIIDINKHPHVYLNRLDADERDRLQSDLSSMFYAFEVEEYLVSKFYYTIFSVLKRMKISSTRFDDYISCAMLAIRTSIWTYRMTSIKFSNYVYNGVYQRILGILTREAESRKKLKKRKITVCNLSDLTGGDKDKEDWYEKAAEVVDKPFFDEAELNMDDIICKAKLSKQEVELIQFYMMKDQGVHGWSKMYREHVMKMYDVKLSKQGTANRLKNVQGKILNVIKKIKGQDFINLHALKS